MSEKVKKHPGGRPSKVKKFVEAMSIVLNEENKHNAIILTDEDLFIMTNELLDEEDQICYTTFKTYKNSKHENEIEIYDQFLSVYKKALGKQKQDLFDKLKGDERAWQRWAWIIERKFDNWNIRNKQEVSGPDGGPIEQIVSYVIPDNDR